MRRFCVLLTLAAAFCNPPGWADVQQVDVRLLRHLEKVEIRDKTISDALTLLRLDLPRGFESLEPGTATTKLITLSLPAGTTVAAALDAIVTQDPRYEWKMIGEWLHVIPRQRPKDYLFDTPFGPVWLSVASHTGTIGPCYDPRSA